MGFFNSLGQVASNGKNFKQWEQQQADIEAQRKAYAKQNAPTEAQLEKAKKEGKVLIDIVDIMDAHSEDVAENTETATIIPQMLVPEYLSMGSGFAAYQLLLKPALAKSEKTKEKFLQNNLDLFQDWTEKIIQHAKNNNLDSVDLKNFKTEYFTNKKNIELLKNINDEGIKSIYKKALKMVEQLDGDKVIKNLKNKGIATAIIPAATFAISYALATIWATKVQVGSSRVARYQSRKQLEDPKYFVQFTPEQIEQAKQTLESKEKEDKNFSSKLFKKSQKASLIQVMKDNKHYKEWKKTDSDDSKKVQRELTPEELLDAKKDKEVIQRVTKIINNKAEDYSENMEVAAQTLIGGTPVLGAGVGAIMGLIANKTGILNKFSDKQVQKFIKSLKDYDQKNVTEAYEALKKVKPKDFGYAKVAKDFFSKVMSSDLKKAGSSTLSNIGEAAKKLATVGLASNGGRTKLIAVAGGIVTGIAGAILGLKLQKASARAGRYLAKRELEQDPNNFIGYTDEELQSVKDVKGKLPTFGQKLKEYITFLPRIIKEYSEYQKYVKTDAVKNKALKEELVKLDVTDEQLKEAKNMQRKMFNTFEKVDDKSQEYSESVEAATEIAKPVISGLGMTVFIAPAVIAAVQIARGKLNLASALDSVTKFLSNHTNFLHGKFANKYLDGLKFSIPNAVRSYDKTLGKAIDPAEIDVVKEVVENINLKELNSNLGKYTKQLKNFIKNTGKDNIGDIVTDMFQLDMPKLKKVLNGCTAEKTMSIIDNLENVVKNIPAEKLQEILDVVKKELNENPEQFIKLMSQGNGIKDILLTKDIKLAAGIAAGTWGALNLAVTFAIESYLAKLQKEAGRLGVMKAIEELDDPLYYADIEKNTPETSFEAAPVHKVQNKYLR